MAFCTEQNQAPERETEAGLLPHNGLGTGSKARVGAWAWPSPRAGLLPLILQRRKERLSDVPRPVPGHREGKAELGLCFPHLKMGTKAAFILSNTSASSPGSATSQALILGKTFHLAVPLCPYLSTGRIIILTS